MKDYQIPPEVLCHIDNFRKTLTLLFLKMDKEELDEVINSILSESTDKLMHNDPRNIELYKEGLTKIGLDVILEDIREGKGSFEITCPNCNSARVEMIERVGIGGRYNCLICGEEFVA